MYDLISIGSVVKDIIVVTDRGKIFKTPKDKLAPEWLGFELGEKTKVDEVFQSMGGVATDISLGLKKMGFKSLPFSTLGNDGIGKWLVEELKKENLKTSAIALENKRRTPFNIILIDKKSGERVIFSQKSSGDLNLNSLSKFKTKYLYVSSLKGKAKKQTEIILNYLKKNKSQLIVSPSTSQIRDDFSDLRKLLKAAKILILNRNEALEVLMKLKRKKTHINEIFGLLHKLGPEVICITDGINGAWASDGKNILHSPIMKVNCVDSTGAGDAFASGFLGIYLKEANIKKGLKMGIANGANVVRYLGTTKGLLTK